MIRRTLDGEVERDFQFVVLRRGDQRAEVIECAECRMDRIMAALGATDGIWTAQIAGFGTQRVIAALAVRRADRMNRRKIQHVEAHRADQRQVRYHVGERAVPCGVICRGTRKHLVPACEGGLRTIDVERNCRCELGGKRLVVGRVHHPGGILR